jgi:hypothetical protein
MFKLIRKYQAISSSLTTGLFISLLSACGGSSNNDGSSNTSVSGNTCFSSNTFGISTLPEASSVLYKTTFCKYLGLSTPNGKSIGFFAQQDISDDQLIRAQRILGFYLAGKDTVANHMADNGAHMMLLKGADGDIELPEGLQGQPLYEKEMIVEGSVGYLSADLETYRDASFEEILHLMHDYGIGIESQPGADMVFSTQIKTARVNAMAQSLWPTAGVDQATRLWIEELRDEGSLSQEYLASVVDSYYGFWQSSDLEPGGMGGVYIAKSRAEVQARDPSGYAVMQTFFQPNISYMARIDAGFSGTFSLQLDNNQTYTYKSQYLTNARLTGSNDSGLLGNALDNQLAGNSGSNLLDGAEGSDTLLLAGNFSDYSIQENAGSILIQDSTNNRDGSIEIRNIEVLKFKDQSKNTSDL